MMRSAGLMRLACEGDLKKMSAQAQQLGSGAAPPTAGCGFTATTLPTLPLPRPPVVGSPPTGAPIIGDSEREPRSCTGEELRLAVMTSFLASLNSSSVSAPASNSALSSASLAVSTILSQRASGSPTPPARLTRTEDARRNLEYGLTTTPGDA